MYMNVDYSFFNACEVNKINTVHTPTMVKQFLIHLQKVSFSCWFDHNSKTNKIDNVSMSSYQVSLHNLQEQVIY